MFTPIERAYRAHRARNHTNKPYQLEFAEYAWLISQPCFYCAMPAPSIIDRVDYRGAYTLINCVPACQKCNGTKSGLEWVYRKRRMSLTELLEEVRRRGLKRIREQETLNGCPL